MVCVCVCVCGPCSTIAGQAKASGLPVYTSGVFVTSVVCDCGQQQTMMHIINSCLLTKLEGGLHSLHETGNESDTVYYLPCKDYSWARTRGAQPRAYAAENQRVGKTRRRSIYSTDRRTCAKVTVPSWKLGNVVCSRGSADRHTCEASQIYVFHPLSGGEGNGPWNTNGDSDQQPENPGEIPAWGYQPVQQDIRTLISPQR